MTLLAYKCHDAATDSHTQFEGIRSETTMAAEAAFSILCSSSISAAIILART